MFVTIGVLRLAANASYAVFKLETAKYQRDGEFMRKEQKEGVFIVIVAIMLLLIIAALTDWGQYKPEYILNSPVYLGIPFKLYSYLDMSGRPDEWGVYISFNTIFVFLLPILFYGVLRAFYIVGRLLPREEKLFKFIKDE